MLVQMYDILVKFFKVFHAQYDEIKRRLTVIILIHRLSRFNLFVATTHTLYLKDVC